MSALDFEAERKQMVDRQLRRRGVSDERVLAAMGSVPRHLFVPVRHRPEAYGDFPLSIGMGQTISQPYMVASMTEALRLQPHERVLELGTGSGYQTAVLAKLAHRVYSIERIESLSQAASSVLSTLEFLDRVQLAVGDGSLGWSEEAPFDAIMVTAGAPLVPQPLLDQLAPGGRLVIPVGARHLQRVEIHSKDKDGQIGVEESTPCRFVDLIGQHGWPEGA